MVPQLCKRSGDLMQPACVSARTIVIVPLYRNEATVRELTERLLSTLADSGRDGEILLVDDACPAGSGETAAAVAAREPRIQVLRLAENVGQQRAVMAGILHATGAQVVVMDGDLQDRPEAVPGMLDRLESQGGAVFAARCIS